MSYPSLLLPFLCLSEISASCCPNPPCPPPHCWLPHVYRQLYGIRRLVRRPPGSPTSHTFQSIGLMVSEASAPPPLLSESAENHCAADIYALHHRLSRCVKQVEMLMSSSAGSCAPSHYQGNRASTSCIRRLGELLREARRLEQRVAEAAFNMTGNAQETSETVDDSMDAPLRAYYRQQLQARFTHLQHDASAAQRLLTQYLSQAPTLAHFPVSCVGTAPRTLERGLTAVTDASFDSAGRIYSDVVPPQAAYIPPAAVHFIEGASPAATGAQDVSPGLGSVAQPKENPDDKERGPSAAASFAVHPLGTPAAAGAATTPEDCIMKDIQQAIHQMKDGALQMSALMEQEKSQMKSAADLLSVGVAKGQANMHELDRVSYVAEGTRVPWMLKCVPGMAILWRTVLQPMWAFLKQTLMMTSIIAVTGGVLLLISVVPRPTVYRVQQNHIHDSRASTLQSTATPPFHELPVSLPALYGKGEPVASELPVLAETVEEVSTLPPHTESPSAELSADL
ncbi:hypothetical protein NXY56_005325 [Leishmania guyanensis]